MEKTTETTKAVTEDAKADTSRSGYVFISYKREEVEDAEQLREALRDSGFEVWWDRDIQCGQVWSEVLDEAVRKAGCIVVMWSERARASKWIMHEASIALDKRIYAPVRIEFVELDAPYNRFQAIDLVGWDGLTKDPGFCNLTRQLNTLLPIRQTAIRRAQEWLWSVRTSLSAVVFALTTLAILVWQVGAARKQVPVLDALTSRTQDQLNQSESILSSLVELQRSTDVLHTPEISIRLALPTDFAGGSDFVEQLKQAGRHIRDGRTDSFAYHHRVTSEDAEGSVVSFEISVLSPLFPQVQEYPELFALFAGTGVNLSFFATEEAALEAIGQIAESEGPASIGYSGEFGEYAFGIGYSKDYGPGVIDMTGQDIGINYGILSNELSLVIRGVPDERFIRRTGKIVSFPDFEESWLLIAVNHTYVPGPGDRWAQLQANRRLFTPDRVHIVVSGREFLGANFREIVARDGYRSFLAGPVASLGTN